MPASIQPVRFSFLQHFSIKIANAHESSVRHVLKTNFYQPTKVAVSFRLDGSFLPNIEYPNKPLAVFMVVGSGFRGFHIRFKDVARGGIRIVQSKGVE